MEEGNAFMVQLRILAAERKDFLKDVAESLSTMDTNILKVDMNTKNSAVTAYMVLEVKNLSHLTRVMRRLFRLKGIISVERVNQFNPVFESSN